MFNFFIFRCLDTIEAVKKVLVETESMPEIAVDELFEKINRNDVDESFSLALILPAPKAEKLVAALEDAKVPMTLARSFIVVSG